MPGLLIIAHAPLASSLKAVASHTFPECGHMLEALDVAPDMPVEEIEAKARELLGRVRNPEALIFTDVFGATPGASGMFGTGAGIERPGIADVGLACIVASRAARSIARRRWTATRESRSRR